MKTLAEIIVAVISLLGVIGLALAFFLLAVAVFLGTGAFTLKTMWLWFVVPTLGLNPLTWAQAAGFVLLVGYLTGKYQNTSKMDDKEKVERIINPFVNAGTTLLIGYLVKTYILC